MSRELTVDEFAFRHNVSNNQAKRMMKRTRFKPEEYKVMRGAPVAGVHKRSASSKAK